MGRERGKRQGRGNGGMQNFVFVVCCFCSTVIIERKNGKSGKLGGREAGREYGMARERERKLKIFCWIPNNGSFFGCL